MNQLAAAVDRQAALDQFICNLSSHTVDDIRGNAAPSVSKRLRSRDVAELWRKELRAVLTKTDPKSQGTVYHKINARLGEANLVIVELNKEKNESERLKAARGNSVTQFASRVDGAVALFSALVGHAPTGQSVDIEEIAEQAVEALRHIEAFLLKKE